VSTRRSGEGAGGRPTIRQVAEAAGVSVATVSRVFAGSAAVSAERTRVVLDAAERLGYSPNAVAQSLASGRNKLVSVLVPNLANPHFYGLVKRMLHDADRDGYQLLMADSDESVSAERTLGLSLLERSDGLVMCAPRCAPSVVGELVARGKPVLVVDRRFEEPVTSSVVVDVHGAMSELVRHLVELGHERLTYVHGPARSYHEQERWRALKGFRRRGLRVSEVSGGNTMEDGRRAVADVLATGCTAVLAHNDLSAIGLVAALRERGVDVPGDMSVTGYDDIPFAQYVSPPLTTAFTPQEDVGSAAWLAMRGLLDGRRPGSRTVIEAEAVWRASTAAPRKR
jgi:DNA-binding LacI/PurR family transcriptional regulator